MGLVRSHFTSEKLAWPLFCPNQEAKENAGLGRSLSPCWLCDFGPGS